MSTPDSIAMLVAMGFNAATAAQALLLTSGDVQAAAEMLVTNPPPVAAQTMESDDQPRRAHSAHLDADDANVQILVAMGFPASGAAEALRSNSTVEAAAEALLNGVAFGSSSSSLSVGDALTVPSPARAQKRQAYDHGECVDLTDADEGIAGTPGPITTAASSGSKGRPAPTTTATSSGSKSVSKRQRTDTPANVFAGAFSSAGSLASALFGRKTEKRAGSTDVEGESSKLDIETLAVKLHFGPAAFGTLRRKADARAATSSKDLSKKVKKIMEASVPGIQAMWGERGQKPVIRMLTDCYAHGLWTFGDARHPVNQQVVPAMRRIFADMDQLPPTDPKRVTCLTTLAHACQDCQQVQAREVLRIFGDLTAQNDTFESQLRYSLLRQKEAALNCMISARHPDCDKDHTQVAAHQQRAHLISAYTAILGNAFGLDNLVAAENDRFLNACKEEIGAVVIDDLMAELKRTMSVKEWLQTLLADINNQSNTTDRLINRDCIFKWVTANMSPDAAHLVFYDEGRRDEFAGQDPEQPSTENQYQPFLSCKVLVDMLVTANMLVR